MVHTVSVKPLLTSIDGVDLHDLDACWVIKDIRIGEPESWKILSNVFDLYKDKKYLFFSTEQSANEYIYWNRPIYSRNQIENVKANKNQY